LRVLGHGEHDGVVPTDHPCEELPERWVGCRQVDVAPPYPVPPPAPVLLDGREQCRRLRIVDEVEVVFAVEFSGVGSDSIQVELSHLLGPGNLRALQPIVDELRDGEEVVGAFEDLPGDLEP
jgi:hypothetical protein